MNEPVNTPSDTASDTPRTDAEINRPLRPEERGLPSHLVYSSFARTLERELREETAKREEQRALAIRFLNERDEALGAIDSLRTEVERLKEDKAKWGQITDELKQRLADSEKARQEADQYREKLRFRYNETKDALGQVNELATALQSRLTAAEEKLAEIESGDAYSLATKDLIAERAAHEETKRKWDQERSELFENIGPCDACAEGIITGSTMHEHKGCVYAERDDLRAKLAQAEADKKAARAWTEKDTEFVKTNDSLRTQLAVARKTLCFFRSVIESGENWTESCQREFDFALASYERR